LLENPALEIKDVPTEPLSPRSLPTESIDAILRAAHTEQNATLRARDEALLALLIYAGLRVQEVCDMQLRDLDLGSGTVIVRSGKAGRARRYLDLVRCPSGEPAIGSDQEREYLLVRVDVTKQGQPSIPGITQRVVQRTVQRLGHWAAQQFSAVAGGSSASARHRAPCVP
jgi:site-specific recombinase XerC